MGLILYEYQCKGCGKVIESLEQSGTTEVEHCKGSVAGRILSAVFGRMKAGEVTQGKRHTDDRPDWVMNTEKLADGQDPGEWRREETKRLTGKDPVETLAKLKDSGASYEIT